MLISFFPFLRLVYYTVFICHLAPLYRALLEVICLDAKGIETRAGYCAGVVQIMVLQASLGISRRS